jgi:hypothetical protein
MGKFWGIGGGFIRGCLVAFCVGVVVALLTYLVVVSMLSEATNQNVVYPGKSMLWIFLLFTTYFMGSAAVLYYGMGYTYDHGHDIGLEECEKKVLDEKTKSSPDGEPPDGEPPDGEPPDGEPHGDVLWHSVS